MNSAQRLLYLLQMHRSRYLSGQELADDLGITRSAIWKAMETLRNQGHVIEGVSNRGYRLLTVSTHLDQNKLSLLLDSYQVHLFDSIDSTNRYAKLLSAEQPEKKHLVLAFHQSEGRGRLGRGFYSPQGGLYMSIVLPACFAMGDAMLITSASSVALVQAIEQYCNKQCQIKWVNDLYLGDKKVAGILTEGVIGIESKRLSAVVIGIGVNLYTSQSAFVPDLKDIATSLFDGEQGIAEGFDANELVCAIVNNHDRLINLLPDRSFLDMYREKSMILSKQVRVHQGNTSYLAWAKAIDDDAHLVVESSDRGRHVLNSGEISIRLEV